MKCESDSQKHRSIKHTLQFQDTIPSLARVATKTQRCREARHSDLISCCCCYNDRPISPYPLSWTDAGIRAARHRTWVILPTARLGSNVPADRNVQDYVLIWPRMISLDRAMIEYPHHPMLCICLNPSKSPIPTESPGLD